MTEPDPTPKKPADSEAIVSEMMMPHQVNNLGHVFAGELVTCTARVNFVGRTSMEVGVRVEAENLLTGERRHTNTCLLTFVAIDADHRPCRVRPLELDGVEDERRFREGKRRREVREALDKELDEERG